MLSGGLAAGNVAVALGAFQRRTAGATTETVITDDARTVPVGGVVRFTYPGDRDPALLLRLDDDVYVAYSVICTHLACEVLWERDTAALFCPCHNGVFDPVDGAPVAGPPERPLPGIRLGAPRAGHRGGRRGRGAGRSTRRHDGGMSMATPPRPIRPLPSAPARDTEEGSGPGWSHGSSSC